MPNLHYVAAVIGAWLALAAVLYAGCVAIEHYRYHR